ncbi:hypothetical protein Tco_1320513 [Tanacetum coccineum]
MFDLALDEILRLQVDGPLDADISRVLEIDNENGLQVAKVVVVRRWRWCDGGDGWRGGGRSVGVCSGWRGGGVDGGSHDGGGWEVVMARWG